jgi:hypothetical protein
MQPQVASTYHKCSQGRVAHCALLVKSSYRYCRMEYLPHYM